MYLVIAEIEYDSLVGTVFDLPQAGVLIIGRNGENDIVLRDLSVSRRHLEVQVEGTLLKVRDLGSRNGTKLNNTILPPQTEVIVAPGNRLQLGNVVLRLQLKLSQPSSPPDNPAAGRTDGASITPHSGLVGDPVPQLAGVGAPLAPPSGRADAKQFAVSASTPRIALLENERPRQSVALNNHPPIFRGAAIPAEPPNKPLIPLKAQEKKPVAKSEKEVEAAFPNFMQMS